MESYKYIPKFSTPEGCWWASDVEYSFVEFPPPDSIANSIEKEADARGSNKDPIWWQSTRYQLENFDCL